MDWSRHPAEAPRCHCRVSVVYLPPIVTSREQADRNGHDAHLAALAIPGDGISQLCLCAGTVGEVDAFQQSVYCFSRAGRTSAGSRRRGKCLSRCPEPLIQRHQMLDRSCSTPPPFAGSFNRRHPRNLSGLVRSRET